MIAVLHINTSVSWRGGEQQLAYLIQNKLVNNIVFCKENSELEKYCRDKKITCFSFKNLINFLWKLNKIITSNKINIIHLHDSNAHTNWYIFKQLTNNNIPVVLHRRVAFQKSENYFSRKKYNDENIKKVICISEAVKTETEKIIDDKNKIVIIHSSIDTSITFAEKPGNNIPKIITTAALTKEKNLFDFIDIAEQVLKNKNAHFYIFGEGQLKDELQEYINHKKLKEQVFLKGFVKDINWQLYQYDLFLFTSTSEGLGTSILDAMLQKVPIVSSNYNAAKEIIEDGKTGFIYKDVDDAAELIEKLLTTYNLQFTTITNACKFVQRFDIKFMQEKILNTYNLILTTV